MNQSRQIKISDRVFKLHDLQRLAQILEAESSDAKSSNDHATLDYSIAFADGTVDRSDSPRLFSEGVHHQAAPPISVRMQFRNYTRGTHLLLNLEHGDSVLGNLAQIDARDRDVLYRNYVALNEILQSVAPQGMWLRRHPTLLLSVIAISLGTLWMGAMSLLLDVVLRGVDISRVIQQVSKESAWYPVFLAADRIGFLIKWPFYWAVGHGLGAFGIRTWLHSAWPRVELDFGPPHHRPEGERRRRLWTVTTLVVLPILANLITDLIKAIAGR